MSDPNIPRAPLVKRSRYLLPAVAIYGVALLLPSMKMNWPGAGDVLPGYAMAWLAENAFFEMTVDALRSLERGSLPGPTWHNTWPIDCGIWANHLFVLALLLGLFRRWGMASAFAGIAALCALICAVPDQLLTDREWVLWPGYFVWCAAPAVLALCSLRAFRHVRDERPAQ